MVFAKQLICINILFIARKTDLRGALASICFHCFYWTDLASLGKEIEMKKWGLRIFSLSHARNKTKKKFFFISLLSSKLTISLISTYKHYAIDIADPSSMQEACHMNFVIDLVHRSLCGSVVEHRSAESEGLRFDSSWGLRIFSLSHARDKTKNIFLYFFTELKTYHLSYFYLQT